MAVTEAQVVCFLRVLFVEKLRLQRLSRTSKTDQLFYDRLAERELNVCDLRLVCVWRTLVSRDVLTRLGVNAMYVDYSGGSIAGRNIRYSCRCL